MIFARNDTQRLVADSVRRLLRQQNEFSKRRDRLAGATSNRLALWPELAEAGVLGVLFPEAAGGFGGSARDVAVVLYEMGQSLVVEPYLTALICGSVLQASDSRDAAIPEIEGIIAGDRILAFAHREGADPFAEPTAKALIVDGGYRLSGIKTVVRNGDVAHAFIVTACLPDQRGIGCFLVERSTDGLAAEDYRLIDASGAVTLRLEQASGQLLLGGDRASVAVQDAVEQGLVGLAAETAGILDALNEATRDYLKARNQFGVPLASFQALQHRIADMYIMSEETKLATDALLDLFDRGVSPGRSSAVSALSVTVDHASRKVGHEAVQLHGGMGVSDELPISHYLRRLTAIRAEIGSAPMHCDRFRRLNRGGDIMFAGEAPETNSFRIEVRDFVRENLPDDLARKAALGLYLEKNDNLCWERILHGRGWYASAWSAEYGGAGWDLGRQLTFAQEATLNDAPPLVPYGVNMVGPVILNFGTEAQRAEYLPGILESTTWWCQGYSEPNSGSDLASLKTFAERDGDHYVVNGTKMWTTEAHWADMMHCLVRTRREGKPQQGISFLLIDMKTPGISIQPILTLEGQHHTNQTFFDNVRVPVANLVGEEGSGWSIAKFLLGNERVAIADTGPKIRLLQKIKEMLDARQIDGDMNAAEVGALTLRLSELEIQLSVLVTLERRYVEAWAKGASRNGPEASLLKIRGTEILQGLTELAIDIEGQWGAVHDPADLHKAPQTNFGPSQRASFMANQYLYSRCWSIFGGTNEIQRNIISRCLGVS